MAKRESFTIDEAFQQFHRREKNPHVACEQLNQALREGLTLWAKPAPSMPADEKLKLAGVKRFKAMPPDYFASNYRVTIERADGRWTARVANVARICMMPADWFDWTVSAPGVDSRLKSKSPSRSKSGRKSDYDWAVIEHEIARRCLDAKAKQGRVPDNVSELARDILEWCQTKFEKEPAESAMRERVSRICAMLSD